MQKRITSVRFLLAAWCIVGVIELSGKLIAQTTPENKPSVILVRPATWGPWLAQWKAYRSSQYQFAEVDSVASSIQLRGQIAKAISNCSTPAVAILLCGDAALEVAPKKWQSLTPGIVLKTEIQLGELTTKELCTDALYGDLDQDGCPDIAVGRLPAKTPEELKRMLQRSIDYESIAPGPWNDTVHVTAGVGGFGFLADTAIETVTRRFLTEGSPSYFKMNGTGASCTSTYCPNPWKLREAYIDRINQGGLFWVYIGHGQVDQLDHFRVSKDWLPIGQSTDAARFRCQNRPPIALMLACLTGAYDARVDCFSEQLLAQPPGPIAVISGSRVTMPYGLSQFSSELINGCFRDRIETLGELVLQAKRRVWLDDEEDMAETNTSESSANEVVDIRKRYRKIVTEMAQALNPSDHDLTLERREH
ncbi:MAG: C25 family cysteine peptidase, partial [Planctomycetota bacterium]